MAKILIVEDDQNLQSIYGDRLKAEGHTIITASDGEEALAVAVKEKPDLVISDVMMPKISGFDMLDILRTTPETRNVKIVMMTALSQAEDRERANKLGADRYLVKSQVTLDDVANTVNEVVGGMTPVDEPAGNPAIATAPPTDNMAAPQPSVAAVPAADGSTPVVNDAQTIADSAPTAADEQAKISSRIDDFLSKNAPEEPLPSATEVPASTPVADTTFEPGAEPAPSGDKPKSNIFDLYEKELAKEAGQAETSAPPTDEQKL